MRRLVPLALLSGLYGCSALVSGPAYSQPGHELPVPIMLTGLDHTTRALDGAWQFHLGDNVGWASPALDDSGWEPMLAGKPWEAQGHYGYTGFAWYRRRLALPSGEIKDANLALYVPGIDSAYEVYWNGALVGGNGRVPPNPSWYVVFSGAQELSDPQPSEAILLGTPQSGVLAIRVWKAPIVLFSYPFEGGLVIIPRVGTAEAVAALKDADRYQWLRDSQFSLAVILMTTVAGILALLLWLRNRGRTMLLCLAIVLLYPAAGFCLVNVPGMINFRVGYGLTGPVIGIYSAALWFLLLDLLGLDQNEQLVRWTKIFAAIEVGSDLADGALQLFDWSTGHAQLLLIGDVAFTIPPVFLELWPIVLVLFAFRKRLDAARWMLAITALLSATTQATQDITSMGDRWTHINLRSYLNVSLITVVGTGVDASTVVSTLMLVAIVLVAWRYSVEQSQRQSSLEQEFRSAQELQQVLIPEALPALPGYAVTSAYRPAQEVGGDFFQLIPLPEDNALLVIGDVSGKGLRAAMAVALIVGAIRSTVEMTQDPAAMLAALNRRLYGRLRGGFATCLVLRLDAHGLCMMANAGHLPPFLNGVEVPLPPALPLGLTADAVYEPVELRMTATGCLTLYTDGLLEAKNAAGELFGFDRIAEFLSSPRSAQQVLDAARQFGQDDDITVLTLTLAQHGAVNA